MSSFDMHDQDYHSDSDSSDSDGEAYAPRKSTTKTVSTFGSPFHTYVTDKHLSSVQSSVSSRTKDPQSPSQLPPLAATRLLLCRMIS